MFKTLSFSFAIIFSLAMHAGLLKLLTMDWQPEPIKRDYMEELKPIKATLVEIKQQPKADPKPQPVKQAPAKKPPVKTPPKKTDNTKPNPTKPKPKEEPKKTVTPPPKTNTKDNSLKDFFDALDEENEFLSQQELAEQERQAVASYMQEIKTLVESYWTVPPSARRGIKATLSIGLVPTGRVVSVTVAEGSGNEAFDQSVVRAVRSANEFPSIKQMDPALFEKYFRQFTFIFEPDNLRL